jgi:hypothetical protein
MFSGLLLVSVPKTVSDWGDVVLVECVLLKIVAPLNEPPTADDPSMSEVVSAFPLVTRL